MNSFFKSFSKAALSFAVVFYSASILAEIDIRAASPIQSGEGEVFYSAYISDCNQLYSANVVLGAETYGIGFDDIDFSSHGRPGCAFDFSVEGDYRLNPKVEALYIGKPTLVAEEDFSVQSTHKDISAANVSIERLADDSQHLVVSLNASSDVDISYVSMDVRAYKASDLINNGGVLFNTVSFVQGAAVSYPEMNDQTQFDFSFLINDEDALSEAEAQNDIVVLVEATLVDAYDDQVAISELSYTGEGISDTALVLAIGTR